MISSLAESQNYLMTGFSQELALPYYTDPKKDGISL